MQRIIEQYSSKKEKMDERSQHENEDSYILYVFVYDSIVEYVFNFLWVNEKLVFTHVFT